MEHSNASLPTGKKFYPLAGKQDHLNVKFNEIFKKANIEILLSALKLLDGATLNTEYWRVHAPICNWELLTEDEYPVIEMASYSMYNIYSYLNTKQGTKKTQYASTLRIGLLDIPVVGNLKLQYDPVRRGLIVHDHPYEGDLVSNKPMVVNKNLKSLIREKVGEIELLALLSDGDKIGLTKPPHGSKSEKGELIASIVPKLLNDTHTDEELAMVCGAMGRFKVQYNNSYDYRTHTYSYAVDKKYSYYLDTSEKGSGNDDFDFTASVRTKLIFHFGGYTLPDNYEDWFDG